MLEVNANQHEAKVAIMEQLEHCKLKRNKNGLYNHDEIKKVELTVLRVLIDTYNENKSRQGMSKLMDATSNSVNTVKTNMTVSWRDVIAQAAKEAKADTEAALLIDLNAPTIAPSITKRDDAFQEAEPQNMNNQTIVGAKEGFINTLRGIIGADILNTVMKTANGSNNRSINDHPLRRHACSHQQRNASQSG